MALNVFDRDSSVIDENANGEGEASQGHDVDGLVQKTEDYYRRQDSERDRDGDDHCAAPASKKNQDHQTRECRGDDGLTDDPIDRTLNEDRLIRKWLNLKLGWKGLGNVWEELADTLDDIDRRGVPGLQYSHQHPTISVLADDVCL